MSNNSCLFEDVNSVVDGLIKFFSEMASLVETKPFGTVLTFVLVAVVCFAFTSGFRNITSKKSNG